MQDKRLTHRLTDYWNRLRGEQGLPDWKDFNPDSFDEIWRQCCGWKVQRDDESTIVYTYEYLGNSMKELVGNERMGKQFASPQYVPGANVNDRAGISPTADLLVNHFHNFPAARILQKIDRTVTKPAIVIEEGRVTNGEGKDVRFRSCLLPFGNSDGQVTHMVLGLSWKTY